MEPVQPGLYETIITERLKKALPTLPLANAALVAVFGDGYPVDGNGMVDMIGRQHLG